MCLCVFVPDGVSEEVLDEGSHEFHPQLDVAVRPLERGGGHLAGALVQGLLLLRGDNTGVSSVMIYSLTRQHRVTLWLETKK